MSVVEEIDKKLATDWPGALWDDYGRESCGATLLRATSPERQTLAELILVRDAQWQIRFLSLLPFGPPQEAIEIAERLLTSADDEVILGAADVLRSLSASHINVETSVANRLGEIAANTPRGIDQIRASSFLKMFARAKEEGPIKEP